MPLRISTRCDYTVTTLTTLNDNFKDKIGNSLSNTSISGATLEPSTREENTDFFHILCGDMYFVYTNIIQSQCIEIGLLSRCGGYSWLSAWLYLELSEIQVAGYTCS